MPQELLRRGPFHSPSAPCFSIRFIRSPHRLHSLPAPFTLPPGGSASRGPVRTIPVFGSKLPKASPHSLQVAPTSEPPGGWMAQKMKPNERQPFGSIRFILSPRCPFTLPGRSVQGSSIQRSLTSVQNFPTAEVFLTQTIRIADFPFGCQHGIRKTGPTAHWDGKTGQRWSRTPSTEIIRTSQGRSAPLSSCLS